MWYLLKQRQIEGVGFSAADFRFRFFVQFVRFLDLDFCTICAFSGKTILEVIHRQ